MRSQAFRRALGALLAEAEGLRDACAEATDAEGRLGDAVWAIKDVLSLPYVPRIAEHASPPTGQKGEG